MCRVEIESYQRLSKHTHIHARKERWQQSSNILVMVGVDKIDTFHTQVIMQPVFVSHSTDTEQLSSREVDRQKARHPAPSEQDQE